MKTISLLLIPTFACLAHADTIRMRNGTEIEGEVVSEQDDHYVVKVQVTKTIRDERKIPKSEILEIVAEKKDEVAFEKLKPLVPTPDLLTLEQYEDRTRDVEDFMKEFSKSELLKEADALLKVLDSERAVVAKGGLKFEGKMIEAGERSAQAYPLDARISASKITSLGDAGDITGALREWNDFRDQFSASKAYLETVPYVVRMMTTHLKNITRSLDTLDERIKKREDGLASIDQRDRERSKLAIADASAAYEAKVAREKAEKIKWPSLDPYHKAPMAETKRMLEAELKRLKALDTSKIPDGDAAWNKAWSTLTGSAEPEEVTAAMAEVRSARLPAKYVEILEAKVPGK